MKRAFFATLIVIATLLSVDFEATAQKKNHGRRSRKKSVEKVEPKKTDYQKLFDKKHEKAEGLFTLHLVDSKVYFEFPDSLFDKEMLIGSTVSKISDNNHAVVGSKPTSPLHVIFTRNKSHVQLRSVSTDYFSTDTTILNSLKASSMPAILENMKIVAYNADSTNVVFEMTDFFKGDNKLMSPFDRFSRYSSFQKTDKYQKENSYISGIKAFKDNVSISSVLSYTYSLRTYSGRQIVKDEPFTAVMTRSIMLLPDNNYRPRLADYRIGVFFTARNKLGSNSETTAPIFFANRWELEPVDTAAFNKGEKVAPVKPIVFYIDDTFPQAWKKYIKEGVEQWNEIFETIGFKNAIAAKDFPKDDPEFDPDNIKYSCIRYAPINVMNAMGPSWVDPRTGQILTASVYVYHDVIKLIRNWLYVQTSQTDKRIRSGSIPENLIGDALRYVISHEVGHCLGLMHNMSGSSLVPVDSLRSPSYTQKFGTTTSIMDYARFNYVAQPGDFERGVKLTPPRFGAYDKYAIKWAYQYFPKVNSLEEDNKISSAFIKESIENNPVCRYGKQQFKTVIDPRSQTEDLGDDAIKATMYGIKNLKYITSNLNNWVKNDDDLRLRQELFISVINQLALYISHVSNNIGGCYLNEIKAGDKLPKYAPLSGKYQKAALNYLFEIYDDLDWLNKNDLRNEMFITGEPATAVKAYLNRLIIPLPLIVSQYEDMGEDNFTSKEAFDMIFDFVWNRKKLTDDDMALQNAYLKEMLRAGEFSGKSVIRLLTEDSSDVFPWMRNDELYTECNNCSDMSPIMGFEFEQASRFASAKATKTDIYAYLMRAKKLIGSRIKNSTGREKAHYQLLDKQLENLFK